MSLAIGGDPPWGFVEWLVTGLSTAGLGLGAFLWRLAARLDRNSASLEWQKAELAGAKQTNDATLLRLSDRMTQLHDEHCRLREVAAGLPTRADLRDMEQRLGERIEDVAARVLESRG